MGEYELGLVFGVVSLIVLLGLAYLFFFKLVPRIFGAALGTGGGGIKGKQRLGGWKRLAETWQTPAPPPARVLERQWVQVGLVIYRRSVTVGASDDGLYLATSGVSKRLGLPPLLIPWSAITGRTSTRFQWMPAVRLIVGPPGDTTIVFYKRVFDTLEMPGAETGSK